MLFPSQLNQGDPCQFYTINNNLQEMFGVKKIISRNQDVSANTHVNIFIIWHKLTLLFRKLIGIRSKHPDLTGFPHYLENLEFCHYFSRP